MRIVVTGGSGFIGRRLVARLLEGGHEVTLLGRAPKKGLPPSADFSTWDPEAGTPPANAINGAAAVIHLAAEPVAQRWTLEAKRRIRSSRVTGTANLVGGIAKATQRPKVLISASAIGYYGDRGAEELTEASRPGHDFLAEVCQAWEAAAMGAEPLGLRVVLLRTGIVLGEDGGALDKLLLPFRLGLGGRIGSGEQWMSWIHAEDAVGLIQLALNTASIAGPLNLTVPEPVTNAQFTNALARALNRPAFLTIPVAALKLLYGEMAQVVIGSQRVRPAVAQKAGYRYRYTQLGLALDRILGAHAAQSS